MCIKSFNVYTFEFKWKLLLGCFLHFPNSFTSFPRHFKVTNERTTSFPFSFHITVSMQSCWRSCKKGHQFANNARRDGVQLAQEVLCMCRLRNLLNILYMAFNWCKIEFPLPFTELESPYNNG